MAGGKKTLAAVGLVILIVAAAIAIFKYSGLARSGQPKPTREVLALPVPLIDVQSGELVKMTRRDVMSMQIDPATSYYKSQATRYATPTQCGSCSATVAMPAIPQGTDTAAENNIRGSYKCPQCGKAVFTAAP